MLRPAPKNAPVNEEMNSVVRTKLQPARAHQTMNCHMVSTKYVHTSFSITRLFRDADVFRLGEEPQSFFAAFAADATGFHSAKGDAEVAHEPAVYPDRAGVNFFGDAMG
jgi:hypothetical protein